MDNASRFWIVGLWLLLIPGTVLANCDDPKDDAERAACLAAELRLSDAQINKTYEELLAQRDNKAQETLRKEQREWLRLRESVCNLKSSQGNREVWFREVQRDYYKAVCVVRLTTLRERELRAYQDERMVEGGGKAGRKQHREVDYASLATVSGGTHDIFGNNSVRSGKYYFELTLDPASILVATGGADFFVGVNSHPTSFGKLVRIKRGVTPVVIGMRGPQNIGIALDLERGNFYVRENGQWLYGAPGGPSSLPLKPGKDHIAVVSSTHSLPELIERGAISINFGHKPFHYPEPEGFWPYQNTPPLLTPQKLIE